MIHDMYLIRQIAAIAVPALILGCGGTSLTNADQQRHDTQTQLVELANEKIDCSKESSKCSHEHWLKGNACYELAKRGDGPISRFKCAQEHLTTALELKTADTQFNQTNVFLALAESEHRILKTLNGYDALHQAERLRATAKSFQNAEPEHPGGLLYLALAELSSALILATENPSKACKHVSTADLIVQRRQHQAGSFQPNYKALAGDISAARRDLLRC